MAAPIKHILTAIATVCTIISLSTAHAADEPENIIKFRQNVMKGNGAHITNIAAVVKGQVTTKLILRQMPKRLLMAWKILVNCFPQVQKAAKQMRSLRYGTTAPASTKR